MNLETQTMVNELLSYLYGSFLITYVLCVIGNIIKEVLYNSKHVIPIKRVIFVTIPVTAVLCMIQDRFHVTISLYVLICLIGGSASSLVADIIMNSKFIIKLLKSTSKVVSDPLIKVVSETVNEMEKEKDTDMDKQEENKESEDTENKENNETVDKEGPV